MYNGSRIVDIFVVQTSFEVGQRCTASSGVWHHLEASVHQALLEHSVEHPPNRFHKVGIHCLVVILKVNPSSQTSNGFLPLRSITGHNTTTFCVIVLNTHVQNHLTAGNFEFLVNLVLNRKSVTIPSKTTGYVVASLMSITSNSILDSSGQNVTKNTNK